MAPRVAPDGARIAFGTDDGNEANIYTYAPVRHERDAATHVRREEPLSDLDLEQPGRVSVRSRGRPRHLLAVHRRRRRRTPHKPEPGTSHVPESWSPKRDRFLFSVTEGIGLSRCGPTRCRTGRRRRSARSTRRIPPTPCFRLMDDGWPIRVRNGTADDLRPALPGVRRSSISFRSEPPASPRSRSGLRMGRNCFTTRRRPNSRGSASRLNRRLPSGILRRCRDRSEPVLRRAKGVRHHTRRQVRRFEPRGTNGVRYADHSADSAWSSTGSKS